MTSRPTRFWPAVLAVATLVPCLGAQRPGAQRPGAQGPGAQGPGAQWQQFTQPEHAGWSADRLADAGEFADRVGSAAFMLIWDGAVVWHHGDIERRFMCHSVRKSLLSALAGTYVDDGTLELTTTLDALGIDDRRRLTPAEKQATVADLLKARSGVYHPAAYETASMAAQRPARGSHPPGTHFYYNNWDFNTLCAILRQESGRDFFAEFEARLAAPLQMQDFRLQDTYYHLEPGQSNFPAYPFRMSARDLARVGQLYLQRGRWRGRPLLSESWVEASTRSYSQGVRGRSSGYGYLWWTGLYGDKPRNYSAQGVGNQPIIVFPEDGLVMVNRADTYRGEKVSTPSLIALVRRVLAARTAEAQPGAPRVPLPDRLDAYVGEYTLNNRPVQVRKLAGRLLIERPRSGTFFLIGVPGARHRFVVEDALSEVEFGADASGALDGTLRWRAR